MDKQYKAEFLSLMGARIRGIREDAGLSQPKLGEMVGIDHGEISRIESGLRCIRIDTLAAFCNALRTRADYLIFGRDPKHYVEKGKG